MAELRQRKQQFNAKPAANNGSSSSNAKQSSSIANSAGVFIEALSKSNMVPEMVRPYMMASIPAVKNLTEIIISLLPIFESLRQTCIK